MQVAFDFLNNSGTRVLTKLSIQLHPGVARQYFSFPPHSHWLFGYDTGTQVWGILVVLHCQIPPHLNSYTTRCALHTMAPWKKWNTSFNVQQQWMYSLWYCRVFCYLEKHSMWPLYQNQDDLCTVMFCTAASFLLSLGWLYLNRVWQTPRGCKLRQGFLLPLCFRLITWR